MTKKKKQPVPEESIPSISEYSLIERAKRVYKAFEAWEIVEDMYPDGEMPYGLDDDWSDVREELQRLQDQISLIYNKTGELPPWRFIDRYWLEDE